MIHINENIKQGKFSKGELHQKLQKESERKRRAYIERELQFPQPAPHSHYIP